MPTIDTVHSVHWRGIGDTIGLAWLAEATRREQDPLSFYAAQGSMYDSVLRLLCQPMTDDPQMAELLLVPDSYGPEIRDGARKLRLDYLRELLGLETGFSRPMLEIPAADLEWAAGAVKEYGGRPVLLFPQTDWLVRQWPSCYWVDLAWELHNRGIPTLVLLGRDERQFANTPRRIWGLDLNKVAALMSMAKLVVGNDSGPAHLSGTIGTKTMVLCGPTNAHCVFGHIPDVMTLTTGEAPGCAGCHYQRPPYRAACDQGCQVLYALKMHVVLAKALEQLDL